MKLGWNVLLASVLGVAMLTACGGGSSAALEGGAPTSPPPTSHDANFSPATLQFLWTRTGLDGEQWDNIMKLINKPEQDTLDWTQFYGYCQDIHDGRGYTIGIFGATTGGANDSGPDAPALFQAFDAAGGAAHPTVAGGLLRAGVHATTNGALLNITDSAADFCGAINTLQKNPAWREAMWRTFYDVYIAYSVQQARQRGFADALTLGSFVDTALNQGATGTPDALDEMVLRSGSSTDEVSFLTRFYVERSLSVDTHQYNQPPNGAHRVKQWRDLMEAGIFNLKEADAAVRQVTNWPMK